ncbi:hypothetical protein Poly21_07430 [Allorhodopirellula heiligendammensis]|uniref:Uncharacterized protein n=1 Tax=Allorhodopirellula heiligendammensis TaxID=2714739 RepID=A0A5C6C767_9BACT|nr:hypothetical protein Poly21_07430 [Allorhodopirellula heiligendammensis]
MRSFAQNDRIFAAQLAFCCAVGIDRSLAIAIGFRSRVRIAEQIHGGAPSFAQPVGTFRIIQFPDAKSAKRREAKSFSKIRNNSANTPKSPPNPYSLNSAKNATSKRPVTDELRRGSRLSRCHSLPGRLPEEPTPGRLRAASVADFLSVNKKGHPEVASSSVVHSGAEGCSLNKEP